MIYQGQNDETLVMLTLAGEQRAYEVLVSRYERAVIAAANTVTRTRFMAEDAAQDAFVTAWMKLNILREPNKFGAWVCRIAKNCAKNMIMRYRSYLSLDDLENYVTTDERLEDPQAHLAESEDKRLLQNSISRLPEKVKEIITLHYFDGLSIAEIADKMRIAEGTVKWQLNSGRKKLRKELCAMNEEWNDTLVKRVMKKVEELKSWQFKNSKKGFEVVYKDVLREVEELPESQDKYHALADVLIRGWWWLPGDKNDALFARIRQAAELGKNDEVMEFIVTREDIKVYGGAKIDFIREKQIPRLEQAGFVKTLGREWFWLGYLYFRNGQPEKGKEAYAQVLTLLKPSDLYHALVPGALAMEEMLSHEFKGKDTKRYLIGGNADELRYVDGAWHYWNNKGYGEGHMCSVDRDINDIFRNASYCDGQFFVPALKVGESADGTGGTHLTFVSDSEIVDTPCGRFTDCQLWFTIYADGNKITKSYYKDGIGIVKQEHIENGLSDLRLLKDYQIKGGNGLLPLAVGNRWDYADTYRPDVMRSHLSFTVTNADPSSVVIASTNYIERLRYNTDSWLDMIEAIKNEYWKEENGEQQLQDVTYAVERAEALARTPMEKAHAKAACSVARRIMETDPRFNPNYTATGHWNFFAKKLVHKKENTLTVDDHHYRWSFEWKNTCGSAAEHPLLCNDVYGILQDATQCIWNEEWQAGKAFTHEHLLYNTYPIKTKIVCENEPRVVTPAGKFENCLKLSLDIDGMDQGMDYRGGKKEYYFAEGIGIIKAVHHYCEDALSCEYCLSAYEGEGEGYMPMGDGFMRRYDAIGLTDGYIGWAEYTYVTDENGNTAIFADRCGIREKLQVITSYDCIHGECVEDELWEQGKHEDSRLRHDINNFHLLCHFLGRTNRNWGAPRKAIEWNKYRMKIIESLSSDGSVPAAWLGHYASTCFRTACALFGCDEKEEGYQYLERAFVLFPEWEKIKEGEELEVGNELIYGGIKVVKGKNIILLPDGTREPISYPHLFDGEITLMYYGMTAPHGWEWFNGVREEPRFKEYIERARKLSEG